MPLLRRAAAPVAPPECLHLLRRRALAALERMYRLLETEDSLQRGAHLRKRHLDLQGLVPILEQIGELAVGQLQTFIEGDRDNLLAFACTVDRSGQLERTERALIGPRLRLGQSSHLPPIAKPQHLPLVTVSVQPEERFQHPPTELQHPSPQASLDLVHRLLLAVGLVEKIDDLFHFLEHLLAVDSTGAVVHSLHHGLHGYSLHLTSRPIVAGRSPFVQLQVTTQPSKVSFLHSARRVAPVGDSVSEFPEGRVVFRI